MGYEVTVKEVAARPTAVIAATTTWKEFPSVWKELLDEVWACLRDGGVHGGSPNIMLYLDDRPRVEIGVELTEPCPLTGRVTASCLPGGTVATTVRYGSYDGLRSAHCAVIDWCAAQGHRLAGPRWEIYGPHRDSPAELSTTVSYLLS